MKRLILVLSLASLCGPHLGWAQKLVAPTWTPNVPLDNSPNKKGETLTVRLQFADPNNKGQVMTQDVTVNVAAWDPTKETWVQAQNRKANAIAQAINNAKLNGVTATLGPDFALQWNPFTRMWVKVPKAQDLQVKGLAIDPKKPKDSVWVLVKDPTKEPNGIRGQLDQKGGGSGSMWQGSMGGTRSGLSTGVDPFDSQSLVTFGFYSSDGSTIDVATLLPTAGETDSQVLSGLASEFNADYSSSGFTAVFNSTADTLTFLQPLSSDDFFFTANTDTGLDFNMALSAVPEPASLLLFGSGLLGLGGFARKKLGRGQHRLS